MATTKEINEAIAQWMGWECVDPSVGLWQGPGMFNAKALRFTHQTVPDAWAGVWAELTKRGYRVEATTYDASLARVVIKTGDGTEYIGRGNTLALALCRATHILIQVER